jgi:hypothetical protein
LIELLIHGNHHRYVGHRHRPYHVSVAGVQQGDAIAVQAG